MPAQLSVPFCDWWDGTALLDNVVVGSGYGGAVAALRLAEAGQPVVVLERGAEYLPGDFPNDIATAPKYVRAPAISGPGVSGQPTGLFEWHIGPRVIALTGNGLGGGSLINAGVAMAPDDDVFRQQAWPAAIRHGLDPRRLSLRYAMARARRMLRAQRWNDAPLPKTRALGRIAPYLQPDATAAPVRITVDSTRCRRCGDCATGCNHDGAKLTLRDTYLAQAADAGAVLVSCATVAWIAPLGEAWQLAVRPTERTGDGHAQGHERLVLARRVVLAAGTVGSTEILQRSRERAGEGFALSPALGTHFSGNGDSLSFVADDVEPTSAMGYGAGPVIEPVGPTITAVVDLRRDRDGRPHPLARRLVVQDGAIPGAIARAAQEMIATGYVVGQLDHAGFRVPRGANGHDALSANTFAQRTQVLLAMGHDGAQGRLVRLSERDRSVPWWPGDPGDNDTYQRQKEVFAGIDDAGAVHLHPPNWAALPASASDVMSGPGAQRFVLTVHPLGGCPMGDRFDDAVVDDIGRVWRAPGEVWPGLFVLDGAIVPTSLGVNPLLTITALAERAMAHLLAHEPRAPLPAALPPVCRGGTGVNDPQAPQPLVRDCTAPALCASLSERLTCSFAQPPGMHAELRLYMQASDWLAMWDECRHRVTLERGRLRIEHGQTTHEWDVTGGWFDLLPSRAMPFARRPAAPRGTQGPWPVLRRFRQRTWQCLRALAGHLWRLDLWATWFVVRGLDDILRSGHERRASGCPPLPPRRLFEMARALARGLSHAAETRCMHYRLTLVRREGCPAGGPRQLTLLGTKPIRYSAGWGGLMRWAWRHGARFVRRESVPPPRESFWEQITDPHIVLLKGQPGPLREYIARRWPPLARPWLHGRFRLDLAALMAQAPLLQHTGDLTSGLQALCAYPAIFTRYALKTRLLDFRLPQYSGTALADGDARGDRVLVFGQEVWPQRIELTVPRGRSSSDPPSGLPPTLTLRLWRYRSPVPGAQRLTHGQWFGHDVWRARSVLLLHAFAQSGSMFTLESVQPNLAATLLQQGFDVWLLEHRISTRLPYAGLPSTMDQIARHDIPAAVRHVLSVLQHEHAAELPPGARLQVFAFGQCVGAGTLAMALLRGHLSHGVPSHTPAADEPPPPRMPMLAAAVLSQTHPYQIGQPTTQAKTWLPALLRNLLGRGSVPFGVRSPVDNLPEAWLDRLLASLPVPPDEHCPGERDASRTQDACATCRRIRFIEAPLFKHRNLSDATHAALPRLFGSANLHLFVQAARCVENERLVDEDGAFVYVHDLRLRKHFGLPVAFLHGQENELFHPDSARRSALQYGRLFPEFASQVAQALQTGQPDAAWLVPGFGHVDVVIGSEAPRRIFEPVARFFDAVQLDAGGPAKPPALSVQVSARPPRAGPWLGHVQALAGGRIELSLAFLIDDRYSDAKQGPQGAPGDRTWAFVRSGHGAARRCHRLAIEPLRQSQAATGSSGYRVAHGTIELDGPSPSGGVSLLAVSVHESLAQEDAEAVGEFSAPHPALHDPAPVIADASFDAWLALLLRRRAANTRRARLRTERLDPARRSLSRQRREALGPAYGRARLLPHTLSGLDGADRISFAAASCRYPGWAVDHHRADDSTRALAQWARSGGDAAPAFGLLLGDQIYADATAGLVDPLSAVERYFERHREAFSRGLRQPLRPRAQTLGDLLATLPVYFTQDDHEFRDGWPDGAALDRGGRSGSRRDLRTFVVARDAVRGFQRLHMPEAIDAERDASYCFTQGPVRFFVLDTRTGRRVSAGGKSLVDPGTLAALESWLAAPEAQTHLNCVASGSVIVPRLAPGSDPTDPRDDTAAWAARDRQCVLELVHRFASADRPRRVLLLAGDYHLCTALTLRISGRAAAAAVVAPALYEPLPYANAKPNSLWLNEPLLQGHMAIEPHGTWSGSGFCGIDVQRAGAGGGYRIALRRWLRSHVKHELQGSFGTVLTIELD